MIQYWRFVIVIAIFACSSVQVQAETAETTYAKYCATCHGANLSGAKAPSLLTKLYASPKQKAQLQTMIEKGQIKKGMPPFEKLLSAEQIRALTILIQERSYSNAEAAISQQVDAGIKTFENAGEKFRLQRVASLPSGLWSFDFLPDNSILATEKSGHLWWLQEGKEALEIKGIPKVWTNGQAGLLEVAVHPDYKNKPWIYLSLSDLGPNGTSMTKIVRGQIEQQRWLKQETIWQAEAEFYNDKPHHFGSRLAFSEGYLFFSVGDRAHREKAQSLDYPYGKIHRVGDEGNIPKDNPFASSSKKALASIWSFGHRNPQGLTINPADGQLWEAEHGPRGGDEINIISPGKNYGWPLYSYGMNYNGEPLTGKAQGQNIQAPLWYWVPSIAVADIAFYQGSQFSSWQGGLLVASLAKQELRLLKIKNQTVEQDLLILKNKGRIRDVVSGPDGLPYLILNNQKGEIFKLVPADSP